MRRFAAALALAYWLPGCADEAAIPGEDAAQDPGSRAAACETHAPLLELVGTADGIMLGEMHGTQQSAEVLGCVVRAAALTGKEVVLSLEMSEDPGARASSLEESGSVGRSVASPETVCEVAGLFAEGLVRVSFHVPYSGRMRPTGGLDQTFHEEGRAQLVKAELRPDRFVIALSGWRHVEDRFSTGEDGYVSATAGHFLPASVPTVRLVSGIGGRARNCIFGGGCGVNSIEPHGGLQPHALRPDPHGNFDFLYDVGPLTPSSGLDDFARCPGYSRAFSVGRAPVEG